MLKVSVRDFQLNAKDYLDKLPIVLTRYNKDIAVLRSASDVVDKVSMDYIEKKIAPQVANTILGKPDISQFKCDMPFCRNMAMGHYIVTSQDPLDIDHEKEHYLCQNHLHKANQEGGAEEI